MPKESKSIQGVWRNLEILTHGNQTQDSVVETWLLDHSATDSLYQDVRGGMVQQPSFYHGIPGSIPVDKNLQISSVSRVRCLQ